MSKSQFLAVLDRVRDAVALLPRDVDGFGICFGRFANSDCHYPGIIVELDTVESELVYRFPVPEEPKPSPKPKAKK